MRADRLAWFLGLAAVWMSGCDKTCDTTAACGDNGMCVAAVCQPLICERTIFATDPQSGECVPLSGCFLTEEQRTWQTCSEDPCQGRSEDSCVTDARCQPSYSNPNVQQSRGRGPGGTVSVDTACGAPVGEPKRSPDGAVSAAGVNNGETPKHGQATGCVGFDNSARMFVGCRSVPRITPQKACEALSSTDCKARRDCTTSPGDGSEIGSPGPLPVPTRPPSPEGTNQTPPDSAQQAQCFSKFSQPTTACSLADATSCLLSGSCQPIGSRCYCPPGGQCDCDSGSFMGCEPNDRLRRCKSSADCGSDERCDNDEACIAPRTFSTPVATDTKPGSASCMGACVPKGCAGMGERMCNEHAECDGGSYGTVCRPKPYCSGGRDLTNLVPDANNCGCDSEFQGCAAQKPLAELRPERSLLVRDPEIIDDPAFALDVVLGKLAPAGQVDKFVANLLSDMGAQKSLPNGALAKQRNGFATFAKELSPETPLVAQRFAGLMHPTALINRIDLTKSGTCGEARLTYALTRAYTDGNQRMTLIVELRVPDDGNGCKSVAQRWAELSVIDKAEDRKSRLLALYGELLKPTSLGQIRTNEFLNRTSLEAWELREFHLGASGLPELVPVAQTVDPRWIGNAQFRTYLKDNAQALHAGSAVIPDSYLAATSKEDGGRLNFGSTDPVIQAAEKDLNAQSCAGCHLTETKSPFVHIGERLGKRNPSGSGYQPVGRAVIDGFLQQDLVMRAKYLRGLLGGAPKTLLPAQGVGTARVH